MENLAEKIKALEEYLKLPTTPVGWKVVKGPDEFPKEAKRPKRDYGFPMTMCQGNTMARTMGITTAFTAEDCDCYPGLLFWGWGELEGGWKAFEDYWMDGNYKKTREAAKAHIEALKKFSFKKGECGGVVISPVKLGLIDPDAIWVYGNPAQVGLLLWAFLRERGGTQKLAFTGMGACLDAVIQTTRTQEAGVLMPCPIDRKVALCQDHEAIFAMPSSKLDEIIEGLRVFAEYGSLVYPWKQNVVVPPHWPPKSKVLLSKIKR